MDLRRRLPGPLERPDASPPRHRPWPRRSLEIAHSGLKMALTRCRSRRTSSAPSSVVDGGEPIECAFNPQEYSITKTNVWTIKPVTGTDTPKPEFGGGMPWTIRVQLLLDVSLQGADESIKDDAIKLLKMMETGGGGGGGGSAPPFVTFNWGSIESPKMVGSSLTIRFVMFRPNGEPSRALVDLELTQSEKAHRPARTRPPARSPA